MAASAHMVHQRIKYIKQKSLVSMSFTCNVSKFLTSVENLKHQSQKTDFTLFRTLWIPSMEADILSAIWVHSQDFWIFFLHRPIVTSHTFPLIMMNPKNLMSVATQGLHKEGGLIGPPCTWKSPYRPAGIGLNKVFGIQMDQMMSRIVQGTYSFS